jgi:hypothetical protein
MSQHRGGWEWISTLLLGMATIVGGYLSHSTLIVDKVVSTSPVATLPDIEAALPTFELPGSRWLPAMAATSQFSDQRLTKPTKSRRPEASFRLPTGAGELRAATLDYEATALGLQDPVQ